MTSLAQHTPLESLLLLHALRSDGLTALRFGHVSEQLKNIPLVRNDPTFDSARLDEDALKHLYLRLLKDEARDDLDHVPDRKRRQASPSLPAVDDAAKHSHLIPRLVHRLYTRYRESIVAEIRNEESRYDSLTREIGEIEAGQWDDKLRTENAASIATADDSASIATANDAASNATANDAAVPPSTSQTELPVKSAAAEAPLQSNEDAASTLDAQPEEAPRLNRNRIDAVINHEPLTSPTPPLPHPASQPLPQQQQAVHRAPPPTSLPPLSEMAPEPPAPAPHPSVPQHVHHGHPLPSPLQSASGYRISPVMQQNGFPAQFARSQPSPQHSPSPSSPRPVLPLPAGMTLPSHAPAAVQSRAGSAQYHSPTQRMAPVPLQPASRPAHMHTPPTYHQPFPPYQQQQQPQYPAHQQPQYPPQQLQPQYPPQQQQQQQQQQQLPPSYNPRPPHQGGRQLPPFQVSAQDPNRMHQHHLAHQQTAQQQQQARPPPTPARHAVPAAYSPHTPYAYPAPPQSARPGPVGDILNSLTKTSRPSTPRPTWKHIRPAYLARPQELASPAIEKTSPVQSRASSPAPKIDEAPAQPKVQNESSPPHPEETIESTVKPTRSSRLSTRRNRASSPASSAIASSIRARSHSILSHPDSNLLNVESTGVVKDEPTTPADLLQEEILHAETSDAPSTVRSSRRSGRRSSRKRKRGRSASIVPSSDPPVGEDQETDKGPAYDPLHKNKIQGHRNFARVSQPILNDITQHKHAGPFQKPVREKDAEGYTDIIKRPQDLKSIKAAITVGARAINAAAAASSSTTDSPAATTPSGTNNASSVILLDKTVDLIPPRAIVNSSQLEKEVMRMFANAVMFNPGDGGMVQDAREMADDIEAKVRDWRQVEGAAASSRAAQLDDADEDLGASSTPALSSKRRKM